MIDNAVGVCLAREHVQCMTEAHQQYVCVCVCVCVCVSGVQPFEPVNPWPLINNISGRIRSHAVAGPTRDDRASPPCATNGIQQPVLPVDS